MSLITQKIMMMKQTKMTLVRKVTLNIHGARTLQASGVLIVFIVASLMDSLFNAHLVI